MIDFLYPITSAHDITPFIKSKRKSELELHHLSILTRVKMDYMGFNQSLPNDHPLIRAIVQINAISEDVYRTYNMAKDQMESISSLMKWFNGINYGYALEKPYFFMDESTPEIIVSTEFEDSGDMVIQQIMNPDKHYFLSWEPVRVKLHSYTDMDYLRMSKETKRVPCRQGINIIEVDLPLLYTQYRLWLKSKFAYFEDGTQKSIGQFLTNVVLPNAIGQQMEIAYFNRVCSWFTATPINGNNKIHQQHAYTDTYRHVDDSILEVMKNYKKKGGMAFEVIVSNLPKLTDMSYSRHFSYSDSSIFIRKQFLSVYVIGVIPLYQIWWKLVKENQWQRWNSDEIAKLKRGIQFLNNQNTFFRNLGNIDKNLGQLFKDFTQLFLNK